MPVLAMLRIRNESRWIERVVRSILPLCERILILDDHSSDGTADICGRIDPRIAVHRSHFEGLDESRDKQWLLDRLFAAVPPEYQTSGHENPYWALATDGDEILQDGGAEIIRQELESNPATHAYKLRIKYLWNDDQTIRVDGVYKRFLRPSLFRLINPAFRFQKTPFGNGANFHCSSIPQELLHHAHHESKAALWHLGYRDREDRLRKHAWYNRIDPNNQAEDCYRHCIQGDVPEVPAYARLKWAGPLELQTL